MLNVLKYLRIIFKIIILVMTVMKGYIKIDIYVGTKYGENNSNW